jgi:hypothetical protein
MRRFAACCRRGISSSESGRGNRSTATRPWAERRTKLENLVRHESGSRLSATRARPPLNPTTMPTWLVHVPVASAIWRTGGHGMRVKMMSPARNVSSSSRRFRVGSFDSPGGNHWSHSRLHRRGHLMVCGRAVVSQAGANYDT